MNARIFFILLATIATACADWPRFRGPEADGTWRCTGLPLVIDDPNRIWKVEGGGGYSGITVAGGRLYTMDRPAGKDRERVRCLDAASGELVWEHEYPADYGGLDYGSGPRASVTIDDGRAYSLGAVGHVFCFDAMTGKVLWAKDGEGELAARRPTWGFASSPVIWKETVIYQLGIEGGGYIAFDRKSGEERWRGSDDPAGYATPVFCKPGGKDLMLAWTPEHIRGMSPDTGEVLWSIPYKIQYGVSIAMPIFHEAIVLVCGYWHGSKAVRLGADGASAALAWEEEESIRGLMAQPLYRDGLVYLLDRTNGLSCFELATGTRLWDDAEGHTVTPSGRNPQATLVWVEDGERRDRVLILNANGELLSVTLGREGFKIHSRAQITGRTWAHPAYSEGKIFARTDKEIVCWELQ